MVAESGICLALPRTFRVTVNHHSALTVVVLPHDGHVDLCLYLHLPTYIIFLVFYAILPTGHI